MDFLPRIVKVSKLLDENKTSHYVSLFIQSKQVEAHVFQMVMFVIVKTEFVH
jgi:hypothetical protein